MKKEGLEERITRWAANCIWSGILTGPILSTIAYGRVSNYEPGFYTPSHETTTLTVSGSFIISGLVVGSMYSFLRRRIRRKSVYIE